MDTRMVVDLLCAKDKQEEITLMWLLRNQEVEEEEDVTFFWSCKCFFHETIRVAVRAWIVDGSIGLTRECLFNVSNRTRTQADTA